MTKADPVKAEEVLRRENEVIVVSHRQAVEVRRNGDGFGYTIGPGFSLEADNPSDAIVMAEAECERRSNDEWHNCDFRPDY